MSTYTLRTANPAKTRADAVVVGLLSGPGGPTVAPGGEAVAKAYGRKFTPLLAALDVKGKPGEAVKVPTGGAFSSPLLVLVGLGDEATATSVRRAAGLSTTTSPGAERVDPFLYAENV